MSTSFLTPSEAASRLGVSIKALRLYEQRGLIVPDRSSAGWRVYGAAEMTRAEEIVALRRLGLSLTQIERALGGDKQGLIQALAAHQSQLEGQLQQIISTVDTVRGLRADLADGKPSSASDLARLIRPDARGRVAFELPWPWGGEQMVIENIADITYITGPLGSGKTRLARRLAEVLPAGRFVGLDRFDDDCRAALDQLQSDEALRQRVEGAIEWLVDDGATPSPALHVLLAALLSDGEGAVVVDMVEDGLDQATQSAVIAYLRNRAPGARPLFLMTRSSSILDLAAMGESEAILFCPANHSPPSRVLPIVGSPGYEALASCIATPDVRARTAGMVATLKPTG